VSGNSFEQMIITWHKNYNFKGGRWQIIIKAYMYSGTGLHETRLPWYFYYYGSHYMVLTEVTELLDCISLELLDPILIFIDRMFGQILEFS
jgi:hypothetical protein